ncbi:hypothetical protein GCM10010411_67430 [Actinomadura fulvescens]|uniref:Holin n=2 Tax=Actinomadura fulvescens TaxID=46160 RepID=A0ABN3QBH6_9ACTN
MLDSIIRTVVPLIVGAVLGYAAKVGLDLPADAVTAIVTPVITAAYFLLARALEQVWPTARRVLLGFGLTGKQPEYVSPR